MLALSLTYFNYDIPMSIILALVAGAFGDEVNKIQTKLW